jgi:hypothetical protein
VNQKTVALRAFSYTAVKVPEGKIEVKVVEPQTLGIPAVSCSIQTPFWSRPFLNPKFFINPDQTALLWYKETYYSTNKNTSVPQIQPKLYLGSSFYKLDAVDYFFLPFPQTLSMKSGTLKKTGLELLTIQDEATLLTLLPQFVSKEQTLEYFKNTLKWTPKTKGYLGALEQLMEPQAFTDFLQEGRKQRPLWVECHLFYQNKVRQSQIAPQLQQEYQELLAKEPQNADLQFLVSTLEADSKKVFQFLLSSTQQTPPSSYGYASLAAYQLNQGKFSEAFHSLEQAKKGYQTSSEYFETIEDEIFYAQKKYKELIQKNFEQKRLYPDDITLKAELLFLFALVKSPEAEKYLKTDKQWLQKEIEDKKELNIYLAYLDLHYQYAQRDPKAMIQALRQLENPQMSLAASVLEDDYQGIVQSFEQMKEINNTYLFLMFLLAHHFNQESDAEKYFQQGLHFLQQGDAQDRRIAQYLTGELAFDLEEILLLHLGACWEKQIFLITFAKRFPEYQAPLLQLAHTLNFSLKFSKIFLDKILK